jgi:hypothetical protein
MRLLTLAIFTIMALGFISVISIACQERNPGLPEGKQAELDLVVQRLKERGLYDMNPEVRARSKIHLKYEWDSMEFCD